MPDLRLTQDLLDLLKAEEKRNVEALNTEAVRHVTALAEIIGSASLVPPVTEPPPDPPPPPPPPDPPPVVERPVFAADKLTWKAVEGATGYKTFDRDLGVYSAKFPATQRSWSPRHRPGKTVAFGWCYIDAGGEHWITPEITGTFSGTVPTPPPPPPPTATAMRFGFVPGGDEGRGMRGGAELGARLFRSHDKDLSASAASLAPTFTLAASLSSEVILMYGFDLPATNPGKVKEVALAYGPSGSKQLKWIEPGNENGFRYKTGPEGGDDYAVICKAIWAEIKDTGVGLAVQADQAGTGETTWVRLLLGAWPEMVALANAGKIRFVCHPYGPISALAARMDQANGLLKAAGVIAPRWFITEDGPATQGGLMLNDNYGLKKNMTYPEALSHLQAKIRTASERGDVDLYLLYQTYNQRDDSAEREHSFGALRADGSAKGELTPGIRDLCRIYTGGTP